MADAGSSQGEAKSGETATVALASDLLETFPIEQHTLPWSIVSIPIFKTFCSTFVKVIRHVMDRPDALCSYSSRPYCWQSRVSSNGTLTSTLANDHPTVFRQVTPLLLNFLSMAMN
jgi:hypothetical protein